MLGNIFKITDKHTEEIMNGQLDIKLGHLMDNETYIALKTIKNRQTANLNEIPPDLWKT